MDEDVGEVVMGVGEVEEVVLNEMQKEKTGSVHLARM